MTKDEKIKSYQQLFQNVIQAKSHLIDARKAVVADDQITKLCRIEETAITNLVFEISRSFTTEDFSDSVSDCATVQISQPVTPLTNPGSIPVYLVKDDKKIPFDSYSAAGRFLADKFGDVNFMTYVGAISKYFDNPKNRFHIQRNYLHGFIPVKNIEE